MTTPALFLSLLFVAGFASPPTEQSDQPKTPSSYRSKSEKAQVKIRSALYAEKAGRSEERDLHLKHAIEIDPENTLARSLLGQVRARKGWIAASAIEEKPKDDRSQQALSEYRSRREGLNAMDGELTAVSRTGSGQALSPHQLEWIRVGRAQLAFERSKFGAWCEKSGLVDEARAEYTNAVLLNPLLEFAWRKLGYVQYQSSWMPLEAAKAAAAKDKAQRKANAYWRPYLERTKRRLGEKSERGAAIARLLEIDDPAAVASVRSMLIDSKEDHQSFATKILKRIPTAESSHVLAEIAVSSDHEAVRSAAAEALRGRRETDFALDLIELIHTPAVYTVEPVNGPGSTGMLVVDTPRFRLERRYDAPGVVQVDRSQAYVGYDCNGLPIALRGAEIRKIQSDYVQGKFAKAEQVLENAESRTAKFIEAANFKASYARSMLEADVRALEQANERIEATNARASFALTTIFDNAELSANDEEGWHRWYFDRVGYSYNPPPKSSYQQSLSTLPAPVLTSCFAAGTLVHTSQGHKAIELIEPGDRVLSQDVESGTIGFQSVLVIHHNPPAATVKLNFEGGETLVPSTYHRFWVAGQGWKQARDLKAGDLLRALSRALKVQSVEKGAKVPVYNLDVAPTHTFFAGGVDCLVHDNTLPEPNFKPFDAIES